MTRAEYLACRAFGRHRLPAGLRAEYDARERMERLLAGQPETVGDAWIADALRLIRGDA